VILLLQSWGLLLIYKIRQCYVKIEMQISLNDSRTSFHKITLNLREYQKSKIHAHELSMNGKMYDVKSADISGDRVELLVLHDIKEEIILEAIKDFICKINQPGSELLNQLHQLLSLNYLSPMINRIIFIPSFSINIFSTLNQGIIPKDSDISAPPPELV
jgi:hypothetical protein